MIFLNSNFEFQVRILTDAVDDITTIDDFLAVSENHILDDVNNCVGAVQVIFCFHFLCLLTKIPWIYDFFLAYFNFVSQLQTQRLKYLQSVELFTTWMNIWRI